MSKQTAAAMEKSGAKGNDSRTQLTLNLSYAVTPLGVTAVTNWSALSFSAEMSGLLTGTITVLDSNNQPTPINFNGYISKKNKVKFAFQNLSGTWYVAKGTYSSPNNTPQINNGTLKQWKSGSTNPIPLKGRHDTDDGTWSAQAQSGGKPNY